MTAFGPVSGCGPGCLPDRGTLPRVTVFQQVGRVAALVGVLAGGVGVAAVVPMLAGARRDRAIRGWFRAVAAAVGVKLVVNYASAPSTSDDEQVPTTGVPAAITGEGTALVVSNHLSWVDIPAILGTQSMRVVAKTEVRGWPVIGLLAARGGTLFIDRYGLRRLPAAVAELRSTLTTGDTVLVFPEGTTRCGRTLGRVHRATLQSAIDAQVPVRPVRLRYRLSGAGGAGTVSDGATTTVAAWVGADSLVASVWRIAATRGLTAEISVGAPIATLGRTRRDVSFDVAAHLRGDLVSERVLV